MADVDLAAVTRARNGLLSGRVQALRERSLLTQADVARELGVSKASVSRWESLDRLPGAAAAERLGRLMLTLEAAERRRR